MAERIMCFDSGNAFIKAVSDAHKEIKFPHALRELGRVKTDDIEMRGGTDDPGLFKVNGVWYAIGAQAMREGDGSVKYGEARYEAGYYGILGAIAMAQLFDGSERNVFVYGSHTPKDLVYRPDLIQAIKGTWEVENCGAKKTFKVIDAQGADEPVMAFRHAILNDDGKSYRGESKLREGVTLIIDIGGFTVALTTAINGKIDYGSAVSRDNGIIDVREDLARLIKKNNRLKIKGANFFNPDELDKALRTGSYNARMMGELDCSKEVDSACNPLLTAIMNHINNYGGLSEFDCILLAGGGGALMEKRIRDAIQKGAIFMAEQDRGRIQYATAYGMLKTLKALAVAGKARK